MKTSTYYEFKRFNVRRQFKTPAGDVRVGESTICVHPDLWFMAEEVLGYDHARALVKKTCMETPPEALLSRLVARALEAALGVVVGATA